MSFDIRKLQVSVGEKEIIRDLSLNIPAGEIHALMGPNGSGKSTLAYTLAGHPKYTVKSGTVTLDKKNLLDLSADQRAKEGIFLAFQYPVEVPGVSVQNMLRAAYESRFGKVQSVLAFRNELQKIAKELHIREELLSRGLNEGFSGGEKKRVEILQLSALKPKYAILDETDSGLDVDAIKIVADGVWRAVEKNNTGILVITHYQRILRYLQPDKVHVMVDGKIVKSGGKEFAEELEKRGYKDYV